MGILSYCIESFKGKYHKLTSGSYDVTQGIKYVYESIADIFTSKKKEREILVAKLDPAKVQRSYEKNTIIKK
jgi:hypothetical protein